MKNIQLFGLIIVIVGSFLPLVHVPVIGNWNYWKVDYYLASTCYLLCICCLFAIINNRTFWAKIFAVLLILLFSLTIFAVKYQAFSYFSFLPFKSWAETFSGLVKLKWGWLIEFLGAFIIIFSSKSKIQ